MIKINSKIKLDLFNYLKANLAFWGSQNSDSLMDFLSEIWPLRTMPSQDGRFKTAYDDIFQHMINNTDWDIGYLFEERLKLLESDEYFNKFIETILNLKYRSGNDDVIKYALIINPYLEKDGYQLILTGYDDNGSPIYKIQEQGENIFPLDFKHNDIPFFVEKNPNGFMFREISHEKPSRFPSFVLALNNRWTDYSVRSWFSLFYYDIAGIVTYIGTVKIINEDADDTITVLDDEFTTLNDTFCSLGQDESYYFNLKKLFDKDFESILYALKDASFNPDIQEKFEKNSRFIKSLIRGDRAERLLRSIKYQIYGYDLSNLYKFKYLFLPGFSDTPVEVDFDFSNDSETPSRIYALIGKNGTGKTQLITSLPMKISEKDNNFFNPRAPLFSKVIAVSYSSFDTFKIPKKTTSFNYVYCGLRDEKGDFIPEKNLSLRFHRTWKKIEKIERINKWRNILLNFIEQDIIDEFLIKRDTVTSRENEYQVSVDGFNKIKNKLSSGQSIVLFIITEIVANIRFDSLLLYDEPETHLHPNAISQLMNTIYELVNEFQSYCIIATHSPLIVRELFSKNVYVIERNENIPSVRRIGLESFGENIATLTEEVFGNKEIPKQYKKIIQELVAGGKSFEDIIALLESDQLPLSLNTRLYVQSLTAQEK